MTNKNITANYTLTRHEDKQHGKRAGLMGRITPQMLEKVNFPIEPIPGTIVLVCGPPEFEMEMMNIMGNKFGFEANKNVFKF